MRHTVLAIAVAAAACSSTPKGTDSKDPDRAAIDEALQLGAQVAVDACKCPDDACKVAVFERSEAQAAERGLTPARMKELEPKLTDADKQEMKRVEDALNACGAMPGCDALQREAAAFVAANEACTSDADCVSATGGCYRDQDDCCVVFLSAGHDAAKWTSLTEALQACNEKSGGGACGCCASIPRPPKCDAGTCK